MVLMNETHIGIINKKIIMQYFYISWDLLLFSQTVVKNGLILFMFSHFSWLQKKRCDGQVLLV